MTPSPGFRSWPTRIEIPPGHSSLWTRGQIPDRSIKGTRLTCLTARYDDESGFAWRSAAPDNLRPLRGGACANHRFSSSERLVPLTTPALLLAKGETVRNTIEG